MGFPGMVIDPDEPEIDVDLFVSGELRDHWGRLDEVEGAEYRRIAVTARTEAGSCQAYIYVLNVEGRLQLFPLNSPKCDIKWK